MSQEGGSRSGLGVPRSSGFLEGGSIGVERERKNKFQWRQDPAPPVWMCGRNVQNKHGATEARVTWAGRKLPGQVPQRLVCYQGGSELFPREEMGLGREWLGPTKQSLLASHCLTQSKLSKSL